jgi:hypothetical protein
MNLQQRTLKTAAVAVLALAAAVAVVALTLVQSRLSTTTNGSATRGGCGEASTFT